MALKPRHKRRIAWTIVSIIAAVILTFIIAPSIITLNSFKPMIERAIYEQTNVDAKLNGDLHFSLLSGAKIVAHDVSVPTAKIGSVMLSVPLSSLFNPSNPEIKSTVTVINANIDIKQLAPATFNHTINIYDSEIHFMGREFYIISAKMQDNRFHGIIRTKNHKYDVEFSGDTFHITNKNNNLDIVGQFFDNGSIRGHMSFKTDDLNSWLDIEQPKITQETDVTLNFEWDGKHGFKYTNIKAGPISGNIETKSNGIKFIRLKAENINYDFPDVLDFGKSLTETQYDLDFYGKLKFMDFEYKHIRVNAIATNNTIQITNIIADDIALTGGRIDSTGAHDIFVTMPFDGRASTCLFSGTPDNWKCTPYTYGDVTGNISINHNTIDMTIQSDKRMPRSGVLNNRIKQLGNQGKINFEYTDVAGTYFLTPEHITAKFIFANNKALRWANIDIPFLPGFMNSDIGNFVWDNDVMKFTPHNEKWNIQINGKHFTLSGVSAHTWVPELDLRAINDMPYTISGIYDKDKISDMKLKLGDSVFSGSVNGQNITLHTAVLNLDKFISDEFIAQYDELEFLTNAPILIPFGINANVSLSADKLIYKGNEYSNFVYSLKNNAMVFSITDNARGNLLVTIEKNKTNYDIFAQMNKFVINGELLSKNMPLNIRDTMITAEIHMKTSGQIAHDIWYNMNGEMDLSFDGGDIIGLSLDEFYASSENLGKLNLEFALSRALNGGETKLKNMHIVGHYENGNFITSEPFRISMRHVDGFGTLEIDNGEMYTTLDLTMRGTSASPSAIQLDIMPNGTRRYSLSEIMINFDGDYLREFVKTHKRF